MDQHETLVLTFAPEQTDVSFNLTQWQGNGTADVVFKVSDGATDIHDFSINIPKPSGDAHIVVEKTSDLALVNTYTFDSATATYTLFVGSDFNQVGVSYDHAVAGNATFTVNNITYGAGTKIPSTDLLFDVTATDGDGDKSATSLQVALVGVTNVASSLALTATSQLAAATNDAAIISGATTASVTTASGTDTTIAGSGGVNGLTGSNGDDVFVFLSAADSNSAQFNTITDFTSGSDRINLAAFGALAFMHLEPTSTAVPPHTLAWIYDSASNQTIVYVNPTDHTLDIGDSALLQIHLQGVTSVQASDFEYTPAATTVAAAANDAIDPALAAIAAADGIVTAAASADVTSDSTSSGSARADGNWFPPAADESFSFHFAHDLDSIGSVRLARFEAAPAEATEDGHGNAVFNWESGSSTEPQHSHATAALENHGTSDHGPIHASASATATATASSESTLDHEAITVANTIAAAQLARHDATPGNDAPAPPGQLKHDLDTDPDTASQHGSATAELQHAKHEEKSDKDANPSPSPHAASQQDGPKDNASKSTSAAGDQGQHSNAANDGHAQNADAPGQQKDSFHFKKDLAASHADPVDQADVDPVPASVVHGHGAGKDDLAAIAGTDVAYLSPADQHANGHANGHAASHGAHDLIV